MHIERIKEVYKYFKRAMDIIISLVAVVLLIPVFILIAIAIKMDSKGRIIFKQERVGQKAKKFYIYKFRTMVSNASQIGPSSTAENDVRITRIGRFLRKTSLDELPQLWNVLLGDMSLVGYRPGVRENYSEEDLQSEIFLVKPGLTGAAQINGRSSLSLEEKRNYEKEYARNISFLTDIKIFFKTIKVVVFREGVN